MRDINKTTPLVNYKISSKSLNKNYLEKPTNCFREIFHNQHEFDVDTVITLTNFRTKELNQYIDKYFEILSNIFKIEITFIDEDTIEVKNFKGIFHMKIFLTLYRILFELTSAYNNVPEELEKRIVFFNDLCVNSDFKELDYLQQLLTSHNKSKIDMGNHCLKSGNKGSDVRIISMEEFHKIKLNEDYSVGNFFKIPVEV